MSCFFSAVKDPNADLDYQIDWTAWLAEDTIATSSWAVPAGSGLTVHDDSIGTGNLKTVAWLAGGVVANVPWPVVNSIVTAAGRHEDRTIQVKVQER